MKKLVGEEEVAYRLVASRVSKLKGVDPLHVMLGLAICHHEVQPLNWKRLAYAKDDDFIHDVIGVKNHLDTKALKLQNCFLPRFAEV